jgi:ElaB/YqjD/DUF883 family membrane-anchored ribosome-binding protein
MTSAMERDPLASTGPNGSPQQGEQLQEAASGLIDQAARTAEAQASTTMTKVGDTLDTVAAAIRDASVGMRETQPQIAGLADTAALRVEDAAAYLREHGPNDAIQNAQRIARQQPALVIGGGLALGLVLGRLLRSGAAAVQPSSGTAGTYGQSRYGPGAYDTAGYGTTGYRDTSYGVGGGTQYAAGGATSYGVDRGVGTELAATDAAAEGAQRDDDLLDDTATGDATRDEAPTVRGTP